MKILGLDDRFDLVEEKEDNLKEDLEILDRTSGIIEL